MTTTPLNTFSTRTSKWFSRVTVRQMVWVLVVLTFAISLQCYLISIGKQYTRYNNFVIFRYSFEHLLQGINLYVEDHAHYYDFYKYSPTFALAMGTFYFLPDWIGVFLFNFLNLGIFLWGLHLLGFSNEKYKWMLLYLFVETGISLSSIQTNLLIAGCILLAFVALERDKPGLASLLITSTVFIKLFGLVAFSLFLLYPRKLTFIAYTVLWFVLLGLLPLVVISPQDLVQQYVNWWELLQNDHAASTGLSFMGWMRGMFGLHLPKVATVLVAALLFCLPLVRFRHFGDYSFRLLMLASVLLWIVIFNHKGESPTYVIAMAGVAIWYFYQVRTPIKLWLLWGALIFTSFSSTDAITPLWIQAKYVDPLSLKSVFTSLIWFYLLYELITGSFNRDPDWGSVGKSQNAG